VNIAWFTEHYTTRGWISRTCHMYQDQEEMTKLENAMEEAFKQFKVR
jgi:hypothetical protein